MKIAFPSSARTTVSSSCFFSRKSASLSCFVVFGSGGKYVLNNPDIYNLISEDNRRMAASMSRVLVSLGQYQNKVNSVIQHSFRCRSDIFSLIFSAVIFFC